MHSSLGTNLKSHRVCEGAGLRLQTILSACQPAPCSAYLKSVVRPAAKFHLALLVVEWEPGDIDLACAFKDTRWDVETTSVISHHHIGWICSIEALVGALNIKETTISF